MFIPWVRDPIKMYLRFRRGTQGQSSPGLCVWLWEDISATLPTEKLLCFDNLCYAQTEM